MNEWINCKVTVECIVLAQDKDVFSVAVTDTFPDVFYNYSGHMP